MRLTDPFPHFSRHAHGNDEPLWRFVCLAVAISVVAVAGRLMGWAPGHGPMSLSGFSLWYDEAFSCLIARKSWSELLHVARQDVHPPLYYLFLKVWMALQPEAVGFTGWARLGSALPGALCAPLTMALGAMLGSRRAGLVAGAFLAIAPYHIYYSHEIRMYALGCLVATAGLMALWQYAQRPGWLWGAVFCVCAALALYTHYYFFLILAAQCAGLAALWLRRDGWTATARRLTLTVFGVFVLYLPWFPIFLSHLLNNTGAGVHAFTAGAGLSEVIQHLFEWPLGYMAHFPFGLGARLFGSAGQVFVFGALLYILLLVGIWDVWRQGQVERLFFWLAVTVAPVALTALYLIGPGRFYTRCVVFLMPAALCLVAQGVLALPKAAYRWIAGGALALAMVASTGLILQTPTLRDQHGHAHALFLSQHEDAAIFCSQPFDFLPTAVYDLPRERTYLLNSDRISLIQAILMGHTRMILNRADLDRAARSTPRANEILLVISDWDFSDPATRDLRRGRRIQEIEERWLGGAYQRSHEAVFFPGTAKWVFCGRYRRLPGL